MKTLTSAKVPAALFAVSVILLIVTASGTAQTDYPGVITIGSIHDSGGGSAAAQPAAVSGSRVVHTAPSSYGSVQQGSGANLGGVTVIGPGQTSSNVAEVQPGVFVIGGDASWQSGAAMQQKGPTVRYVQTVNSSTGAKQREYYEPSGVSRGQVVYRRAAPPVGTIFYELPSDCAQELSGGRKYIRCGNGVYLKEKMHKGGRAYVVVNGP